MAAERRDPDPAYGKSSTQIGSLLLLPSIVIEEDRPTEVTPGTLSILRTICSCTRAT